MTFHAYPKAKYRTDGLTAVVHSKKEDEAQDPDEWFDSPALAKAGPPPKNVDVTPPESDESWEAAAAVQAQNKPVRSKWAQRATVRAKNDSE